MKKSKAFTLLETIVVIIVFCIWILAVLHWLSQTLRNKDYANTQIKSAFFAREWIELIFNLRDTNYDKELDWNCIFKRVDHLSDSYSEDYNPFCNENFWSWNVLKVSIWSWEDYVHIETWTLNNDFESDFTSYQIYFHTWDSIINNETWFIFDYNNWDEGKETWFARYVIITWVVEDDVILDKNKLLKIESHVLYKRWALTWEKVMETFIGNYEFNQ